MPLLQNHFSGVSQGLRHLSDFEASFALDVSALKTFLWGTSLSSIVPTAETWGVSVRESVESLGTEWAMYPTTRCSYQKGIARIGKAEERLRRISHLMAPLVIKMHAIITGALSLIDHAAPLPVARTLALRKWVRLASGLRVGAPEIVFGIAVRLSLDPWFHWVMVRFSRVHPLRRAPYLGSGILRGRTTILTFCPILCLEDLKAY